MSIYDQLIDTVLNLERLEHRLYKNYSYTGKWLKVICTYYYWGGAKQSPFFFQDKRQF